MRRVNHHRSSISNNSTSILTKITAKTKINKPTSLINDERGPQPTQNHAVRMQYQMPIYRSGKNKKRSSQLPLFLIICMLFFCFLTLSTSDTAVIYIIQLLSSSSDEINNSNYDSSTINNEQQQQKLQQHNNDHKNGDVPNALQVLDNNKKLLTKEEEKILLTKYLYSIKLSNNIFFPKLGLSCGTMDHKKIPFSIANMLLPYMHSSNGDSSGGGGLVYIDNTVDNNRNRNMNSVNKDNEALISRAILYFIHERIKKRKNNHFIPQQHNLRHHHIHNHHTISPSKKNPTNNNNNNNKQQQQSTLSSFIQYYGENLEIHIVLKISQYELGYNETMKTISNSLAELMPILSTAPDNPNINSNSALDANVHVKIHLSLYLPRCNPTISWLKCHDGKNHNTTTDDDNFNNKWKESWKAIHTLYKYHHNENKIIMISSIGISNFNTNDMKQLLQYAEKESLTIPHFYQGDINFVFFDEELINLLKNHDISFIVYHTFSNIFTTKNILNKIDKENENNKEKSMEELKKLAYNHWKNDYDQAVQIANNKHSSVSSKSNKDQKQKLILQNKNKKYTIAQLLLAWLTQSGYIVINKAMTKEYIIENSINSISEISNISKNDADEIIKKSIKNILSSSE